MKKMMILALLTGSLSARADEVKRVFCAFAQGEIAQAADMQAKQFFILDTSTFAKEGDAAVADMGNVGVRKMNLNVYLTDEAAHEVTMQLDEQTGPGASELLVSTVLAPEGMTELTFRAPGEQHLVFVGCQFATDGQIETLKNML